MYVIYLTPIKHSFLFSDNKRLNHAIAAYHETFFAYVNNLFKVGENSLALVIID